MTTFSNILLENTSDIDIREFALEYNRAYVDYVYESADSIVLERKNEDEQLTSSEKKSFSNFLKKIIEAFKSLVRRICKKFKNITKKPMEKKEIKDSKSFKKQRRYTYKQLEDQMYTDLSKGKKLLRKIESNTGVSEEEIENFCNSSIKFFDKNKKEIILDTDNCTWTWISYNGVKGFEVQSKKVGYDSKSIFLPVTGRRDGGEITSEKYGWYWSSSLKTDIPRVAYSIYIYGGN